jgi:hypothetical protein
MAWRWRKSIGRGPFRINLTKRGIGWSVGVPGLRYGRSPSGRKYISQGIPGTGLYRIKYLPTNPQLPAPTPGTQPGPLPVPPPIHQPPPIVAAAPPAPTQLPGPGAGAPMVTAPNVLSRASGAITRFFDRMF